MQGLSGVRDWNFWLSACASLPFCALKPDPEAEADELVAPEGAGVGVGDPEDGMVGVGEPDAGGGVWAAESDAGGGVWAAEPDAEGGVEGFCAVPLPVLPLPVPVPPGTPGDWTRSVSCSPAGTGPEVCAGQLPGGFTGVVWPNGIVPGAPTWLPPTNLLRSTPWNWHWKSPASSWFCGACWQYGILTELGCQFTKRTMVE